MGAARVGTGLTLSIVVLALGLLPAPGCSTTVKQYECAALTGLPSVDARAVWDCNREIMRRVVKKKQYTMREFSLAAEFFSDLTGLPADVTQTARGLLPGDGLKQNLRDWDAWLTREADRLYWDAAEGRVRVRQAEAG